MVKVEAWLFHQRACTPKVEVKPCLISASVIIPVLLTVVCKYFSCLPVTNIFSDRSELSGNCVPNQLPSFQVCETKLFVVVTVPVVYVIVVEVSPGLGVSISITVSALLSAILFAVRTIKINSVFIIFFCL